jgi:hypothetical protein
MAKPRAQLLGQPAWPRGCTPYLESREQADEDDRHDARLLRQQRGDGGEHGGRSPALQEGRAGQ